MIKKKNTLCWKSGILDGGTVEHLMVKQWNNHRGTVEHTKVKVARLDFFEEIPSKFEH